MKRSFPYRRVLRDSIRMYFAPLTGALKGIRAEWRRIEREIEHSRLVESRARENARQQN